VPQDDYKNMAEKINRLLNDDKLRERMGMMAEKLTKRFDRKKICKSGWI